MLTSSCAMSPGLRIKSTKPVRMALLGIPQKRAELSSCAKCQWHWALSLEQANGRMRQQDDGVFQQDRDFLNAIRHLLWSEWSWVRSHIGGQEGFSCLPKLARPEIPPFWRKFPLNGWHVPGRDVARTRMPCRIGRKARKKLGK